MPTNPGKTNKSHKGIIITCISGCLMMVLAMAGVVGFTLYSWIICAKDPDRVAREWKATWVYNTREASYQEAMVNLIRACPGELPEWQKVPPVENPDSTQFIVPEHPHQLNMSYRRSDGSDHLILRIITNPDPDVHQWFGHAVPYIPQGAARMTLPNGMIGWVHESYGWNAFLPHYDQKQGNPKACVMQIYVGPWQIAPVSHTEWETALRSRREARTQDYRRRHHPSTYWNDGPDPATLTDDQLEPILSVPYDGLATPIPSSRAATDGVPHHLAILIVARDRGAAEGLLKQVNLKVLAKCGRPSWF